MNGSYVTYFDSFAVEQIPKEIKNFIGNKIIKRKICRTQWYVPIMCECLWVGFINFMFNNTRLTEFANLPKRLIK